MSPEIKKPIPKADSKPLAVNDLLGLLEKCKSDPENLAIFLAELARLAPTLSQENIDILQQKLAEIPGKKSN